MGLGRVSDYADWLDYWVDIVGVIVTTKQKASSDGHPREPNRRIVPIRVPLSLLLGGLLSLLGLRCAHYCAIDRMPRSQAVRSYNSKKGFLAHAAAADMPTYLD